MRRTLVATVLSAAISACAPAPDSATGSSVSSDSAGITITQNSAPALTGDKSWSVQLQPLTEIGANQNDSSQMLHEVHGAIRLSDGRIVVANSAAPAIRWYDAQGKLLQSAGRAGNGPGEFALNGEGVVSLSSMWRHAGDTIAALSSRMRIGQLLLFGPDARYLRTIEVEPSSTGQRPQIFAPMTPGYAALVRPPEYGSYGPVGAVNRDSVMFLVLGAEGKVAAQIGWRAASFTHSVSIMMPGSDKPAAMPLSTAFAPHFSRAAGGGRIYYGYSDRYEIQVYDDHGVLRQLIRRNITRVPVTAKEQDQFRQTMSAQIPDGMMRKPMERALEVMPFEDSLPVFRRMVIDSEGMLWVEAYVLDGVAKSAWSVFDKSGRWITDVELPTAWDIREIGSDYLIAIEEDALDVQTVRVFRLARG